MYEKLLASLLVVAVGAITVSSAYALDLNTTYFVDSQNVFFIVDVDSAGKATLSDAGCSISNEWQYLEEIKVWRTTEQGDNGRVFGKTTEGNYLYGIYSIDGDKADLFCKVWHDGIKTRVVEKGTVEPLF